MMPHVDLDRLAGADRLDLVLLDRAQELRPARPAAARRPRRGTACRPIASTNLPVWRSVAPVKAPFSWPNRIDSTRLSGMAPQLTATNGLARRSPEPWMARAISSLPTPDWPSISTGMAEPAAFSRGAQHCLHARAARDDVAERERAGAAALDAGELAFERARGERIAQRSPAAARRRPA